MIYKNVEFSAIVTKRKNYRERDMLVTMFTDKYGFKTFFVRGVRKRGFKLEAAILPFTHGTYIGSINSEGLSFITATKDIDQFQSINQDIILNAYATYILELVKAAFEDSIDVTNTLWFEKVLKALSLINDGFDAQIIANIIEVQLLGKFGVQPNWRSCVICGETQSQFDYSESYGGILCRKHWYMDKNRLNLDQRTMYYLRKFSIVDLNYLNSIKVNADTKKRLKLTLNEIYDNQVGIYVKARSFIDKMTKVENNLLKKD